MKYTIYQISIGTAKYIGSTNNYQKRMAKHRKDLASKTHVNDRLQHQYNIGHGFKSKILTEFDTLFRYQVLIKEQRYINRYSNCNEAIASKVTQYSKKEFIMDLTDWIVNNWKLISCIIFIVLIFGFTMTPEQALNIIDMLVIVWSSQ